MRIPNIFTPTPLTENTELDLDEAASLHLAKVLRMSTGDELRLFNGDGKFYPAELVHVGKKKVSVLTKQALVGEAESPLHTHIGQVISRGDRMDYAIQKSTELGVSEITPLLSERCEVKLNEDRREKRVRHWQQVAISAAEQCGRSHVPTVHSVQSLNEWVSEQASSGLNLVLHHRDTQRLDEIDTKPGAVKLLIGPEGGLSEAEIGQATEAGFIPTTLGPRVMRTETAPVSVLSIIQWLWGDLQGRNN